MRDPVISGMPVPVGVVGLGSWGERHVRAWQSLPGFQVAAVADADPSRAREIADRYGIPRWYSSVVDLANDPAVRAVSVATDERHHLQPALAVISAGLPLLVEKPLAVNYDEARQIVEAAERAGVALLPGHQLRFDPRFALLKDRVDRGALGRLASLHLRRVLPRATRGFYARTHPALSAAIHDVDIALWLVGQPVAAISAFERCSVQAGEPDVLWAVIEFQGGTIAVIELLWLMPAPPGISLVSSVTVAGTDGIAQVEIPGDAAVFWTQSGAEEPDVVYTPDALGDAAGVLRDELAYFAACFLEGRAPTRITGREALAALDVTLQVISAASRGGAVPTARPRAGFDDRSPIRKRRRS